MNELRLIIVLLAGCFLSGVRCRSIKSDDFDNERAEAYRESLRISRIRLITSETNTGHGLPGDSGAEMPDFSDIEYAIYNMDAENENLVEGDIMVIPPRVPISSNSETDPSRVKRKIVTENVKRWTEKTVPWRIGPGQYDEHDVEYVREAVRRATADWASRSCVAFPEIRTGRPKGQFIEVVNGDGCWSHVGMTDNSEAQPLSLNMIDREFDCFTNGIIMHEFGHALGFSHEQSRPDRDEHASILVGNILTPEVDNFQKRAAGEYSVDETIPYDASSLMHYSLTGFQKNGARTITMKDPELNILAGQRDTASWYDEVAVNKAYDCADGCENNCENDGYVRRVDGECRCFCPPQIGGANCEQVSTACGSVHVLESGETIVTSSQNYPGVYNLEECAYLYKAPAGHHLILEFTSFDLPKSCRHTLDIRKNIVGQQSGSLLCGSGMLPESVSTATSIQKDKILVFLNATNDLDDPKNGFSYKVTAVPDPCLDDPCHGAPCSADGNGGYKCDFLDEAFHCGFELGFMGSCSVIIPNRYYDDANIHGRAWDMATEHKEYNWGIREWEPSSHFGAKSASEGTYFLNAPTKYGSIGHQVGTISIVPHKIGGEKWCLDFEYAVFGPYVGELNVYQAINGEKGELIFKEEGTKQQGWVRQKLTIDGTKYNATDMIEVVLEAVHTRSYEYRGDIGLDNFKFSPGACPTDESHCNDYPCGTHQCVQTEGSYKCINPSKDVTCSFESAEDDCNALIDLNVPSDIEFIYNTGSTPTFGTGPEEAHTGRRYVYIETNSARRGDQAFLRIQPFSGKKRKLSLWYNAFGDLVGTFTLNRAVNGNYPGEKLDTIFSGDQGREWKYYETVIDNSSFKDDDIIELYLEAVLKRGRSGDIAVDDISYSLIE